MGWLSDALNTLNNNIKKVDPVGSYSVTNPLKTGDWLVKNTAKGLSSAGIGENNNDRIAAKAEENQNNFGLSAQRAGTVAAMIYGAIGGYGAAAGEAGSGAGASAGGGIGGGEALGSGATYYEAGGGVVTDGAYGLSGAGGASGGGYLEAGGGYVGADGSYVDASGNVSSAGSVAEGSNGSLLGQVANNKAAQNAAMQLASRAVAKPTQANQGTSTRPVTEMPDPEAQALARRRKLAEQLNRRGRAASIMTSDGG